jgi:hypothetical protein
MYFAKLLPLNILKCSLGIVLVAILGGGCNVDEIVIEMTPNNDTPEFAFRYLRKPEEPVRVFSIEVSTVGNEDILWSLHARENMDISGPARYQELPVRERSKVDWSRVQGVPLNRVVFSEVPAGFEQTIPGRSHRLLLENGKRYRMRIMSGAGEGAVEFTLTMECKKIFLTPLSRQHKGFTGADRC